MMQAVEELIWQVRRLFRELAQASDEVLAPLGITAAERALLEFLAREDAPVSLSEIARKRAVSRQHIHQTLGRLDPKWIERSHDPADARFVSVALSKEGRALWKKIRAVDRGLLDALERRIADKDVRAATVTLQRVRDALRSPRERNR